MPIIPTVPEYITVHLGRPDEPAENVTVPFSDYLKNVASSEIYPTWPTEAIKANIYAQSSVALNRIYTEHYRAQGYDFDITASPANDQTYIYGRDIFDPVAMLVDELYGTYLRRGENVEPLFATFCDGDKVTCNGLSQWGTVALADQGQTAEEMIRYYYGSDVNVVTGAPIENQVGTPPLVPLREGDTGRDVELIQRRLNRISRNYPGIPKIYPQDGFFDRSTTDAVRTFQEVFGIPVDGIVGRETWYKIQWIYNAVKRLQSVNSEGLALSEVTTEYPGALSLGMRSEGVANLQYYLDYIAAFVPSVRPVAIDGIFGSDTRASVISFEETYGLEVDGEIDRADFARLQNVYYGLLVANADLYRESDAIPFPGRILREGVEGDDVRALQRYLSAISERYTDIPSVTVDGIFGGATANAVRAFQKRFDLPESNGRVNAITWAAIVSVYEDAVIGSLVNEGQYPGYVIGQ